MEHLTAPTHLLSIPTEATDEYYYGNPPPAGEQEVKEDTVILTFYLYPLLHRWRSVQRYLSCFSCLCYP